MKTIVRRTLMFLLPLAAIIIITLLAAPYLIDSLIIPRLLANIAILDKSASISRITPFSTRGTLRFEDKGTSIASVPRFEMTYSPASLIKRRIFSLTIDHATIHVTRDNNGFHLAGFSPDSTATSPASGRFITTPIVFPAAIETLRLKQCSVIIHERGQADNRFTLTARADFTFTNQNGPGFALSSVDGSFFLFDSMSANGSFALVIGDREHTVSINLQTALDQLSNRFIGPGNTCSGSLAADLSARVDAKDFKISGIKTDGIIEQFQFHRGSILVRGGKADSTLSFSLSGSPQNLSYSIGTVFIDQPVVMRSSIAGNGSYSNALVRATGMISTTIDSPIFKDNAPLPLSLDYDLQIHTDTRDWQTDLSGTLISEQKRVLSYNDVLLVMPDITSKVSLSGTEMDLSGQLNITATPFSAARGQSQLDISTITLNADLTSSADRSSVHLRGSIPTLNYPTAGVTVKEIVFNLPFDTPFSPELSARKGAVTVESVNLNDNPLLSVSTTLSQSDESVHLAGTVRSLFSETEDLRIDGVFDMRDRHAHLDWSLDSAPITSETLVSIVPASSSFDFNGVFSTSGQLSFKDNRLSGHGLIALDVETFQIPDKNVTIDTISCNTLFPDLPSLASKPSQRCSAELLDFGNLHFSDARIDFRIEDQETLFIEKSSVRWCQGKLESASLRLSKHDPEINTVLYSSKINFSDLLNQFGLDQAAGEGTLNGKLPIALSKGGLFFDDGFLFSTPGTGGIIKFSDTDMLRQGVGAADVGGYLDYSMKAMEDFAYEWTKLSFNSSGEELLLSMELNGKPRTPLPYGFKNGMIIETDKGDGLQYPIQLDVNFRLPLAELFQFGQNIQSIKENM